MSPSSYDWSPDTLCAMHIVHVLLLLFNCPFLLFLLLFFSLSLSFSLAIDLSFLSSCSTCLHPFSVSPSWTSNVVKKATRHAANLCCYSAAESATPLPPLLAAAAFVILSLLICAQCICVWWESKHLLSDHPSLRTYAPSEEASLASWLMPKDLHLQVSLFSVHKLKSFSFPNRFLISISILKMTFFTFINLSLSFIGPISRGYSIYTCA